jgi:hypothetical protein
VDGPPSAQIDHRRIRAPWWPAATTVRTAFSGVFDMNQNKFQISGIAFMIAGIAFSVAGVIGKSPMFIFGCSFIAIGGAFIAISKRKPSA